MEIEVLHEPAAHQPGAMVAGVVGHRAQVQLKGPFAVAGEPGTLGHAQPPEGEIRVQVESLFVNELFAAMSKSAFGEGMTGASTAREIFIAQRNSALAEEMGKRGDLGMARLLYEELLRGMQRTETQTGELDDARGIAAMAGKEET